ncbi:MAG: hypothetical protein HY901_10575, partial [Deltaproteobacteria bacterium]|nr:hypothetical protein [Deltaproteobacteria bacterium]
SDSEARAYTNAEVQGKVDTAQTLSTVGVAALSVGGAALVAGVITFLIPGSDGPQATIAPTRGGAMAAITFQLP